MHRRCRAESDDRRRKQCLRELPCAWAVPGTCRPRGPQKPPMSTGRQSGPYFITKTILSNVPVLAVDQTVGEKEGQKVIIGKTATIQVDPQQAEIIANARQQGTISLALRSILDSNATTAERPRPRTYHVVNVYFGGDGSDEKRPRVTYVCVPDCYHANRENLSEITTKDDDQAEAPSATVTSRE